MDTTVWKGPDMRGKIMFITGVGVGLRARHPGRAGEVRPAGGASPPSLGEPNRAGGRRRGPGAGQGASTTRAGQSVSDQVHKLGTHSKADDAEDLDHRDSVVSRPAPTEPSSVHVRADAGSEPARGLTPPRVQAVGVPRRRRSAQPLQPRNLAGSLAEDLAHAAVRRW